LQHAAHLPAQHALHDSLVSQHAAHASPHASPHTGAVDAIGSYGEFRRHAIETGWLPTLIRGCAGHEQRWEGWLRDVKEISEGLSAFVDEAMRRELSLELVGP